jgi:MFS transporter, DHA1 family, multidrug resistance protein
MLDVLASLFLIDIASTFLGSSSLASVAIVSQIATLSSIAAVVFGVLNGFFSIKVNHKKLLLFGSLCIVVGAVGCFFAPSLLFMAIFYTFDGIGTIIVVPMAFTLIGEFLPLEKRAKSIGWVTAGAIFSSAIGFGWAGFIGSIAGWRSYLLWYVIPISFTALALVHLTLPYKNKPPTALNKQNYSSGLREVLLNKSAAACLFGTMLISASSIWSFFASTFWRKQFFMPVEIVGLITLTVVLIYALGSIIGGRIIDKLGRKRIVVISWAARGASIAAIVFMPTLWSALLMTCLSQFVGGIVVTSSHSLNLEQAPKSRGTMMSLSGVFASIGVSLGVAVGGLTLNQFGFQLLGVTFAVFGISAAFIIYFLATDPCKK